MIAQEVDEHAAFVEVPHDRKTLRDSAIDLRLVGLGMEIVDVKGRARRAIGAHGFVDGRRTHFAHLIDEMSLGKPSSRILKRSRML